MALRLNNVERAICRKFHIHGVQFSRDILPIMGYEGTRDNLAELFGELDYRTGAEIGVQKGNYSIVLLKNNPKLKLYLVDPWKPFLKHNQEWQNNKFKQAEKKCRGYDIEIIRKESLEAVKDIPDGSLDFVYIDAMHYFDDCMVDIINWAKKVRSGGIVSGHDYDIYPESGVCIAVDAYVRAHCIVPYFITRRDYPKSWFFAKP